MNKHRINKNKILDTLYQYMLESNDPLISCHKINKDKTLPAVYFGMKHAEFRFYANKELKLLEIKSYFSNKDDNYQTYIIGSNTASLLNIPRPIYEMIESILIDNNYNI